MISAAGLDLPKEWIDRQLSENTPPFFVTECDSRLFAVSKTVVWYIFPDKDGNRIGDGGQAVQTFAKEYFTGKIAAHGWALLNSNHKLAFSHSEIECLKLLENESGVIKNLGHYYYRNPSSGILWRGMLTEYYPRKHLDIDTFYGNGLELSKKLIETVARIHSKGVMHRDIKPRNILLDDSGDPIVADFGYACVEESILVDSFAGTPAFYSPEHVKFYLSEQYRAGKKDDVWAIAVTVYKIIFRRYPYYLYFQGIDVGPKELAKNRNIPLTLIERMRVFDKTIEPKSDILCKLKKMFAYLASDRPSLLELLPIDSQKEEVKPLDKPKQIVIIQSGIAFYADGRMKPVFF